jgi:hypothetical protein
MLWCKICQLGAPPTMERYILGPLGLKVSSIAWPCIVITSLVGDATKSHQETVTTLLSLATAPKSPLTLGPETLGCRSPLSHSRLYLEWCTGTPLLQICDSLLLYVLDYMLSWCCYSSMCGYLSASSTLEFNCASLHEEKTLMDGRYNLAVGVRVSVSTSPPCWCDHQVFTFIPAPW